MKTPTQFIFSAGLLLFALLLIINPVLAASDEEITELNWQMLIPKDFQMENPLDDLTQDQLDQITDSSPEAQRLQELMEEARNSAPVVEDLNDKVVKLPGFVVPVEFDGSEVSEFLLVPYFGACIHVPPPPANQIVYVKSEKGLELQGLFAAVWVTGKMKTLHQSNELAEAGYTIEAYEVTPYQ